MGEREQQGRWPGEYWREGRPIDARSLSTRARERARRRARPSWRRMQISMAPRRPPRPSKAAASPAGDGSPRHRPCPPCGCRSRRGQGHRYMPWQPAAAASFWEYSPPSRRPECLNFMCPARFRPRPRPIYVDDDYFVRDCVYVFFCSGNTLDGLELIMFGPRWRIFDCKLFDWPPPILLLMAYFRAVCMLILESVLYSLRGKILMAEYATFVTALLSESTSEISCNA